MIAAATPRVSYNRDVSDVRREIASDNASRKSWMVRKYRLGHEPGDDLSGSTTAEERLAMMWPLALEAWTLSGAELPAYDRGCAPVRKFRRA